MSEYGSVVVGNEHQTIRNLRVQISFGGRCYADLKSREVPLFDRVITQNYYLDDQ